MRPVSATLFRNTLPIPSEIDLHTVGQALILREDETGSGIVTADDGQPALARVNIRGQALAFPVPVLTSLGWEPGQTFLIQLVRGNELELRPIDATAHPDFKSPLQGPDGYPVPPHFLFQAFTSMPEVQAGLKNGARAAKFVADKAAEFGKPLQKGDVFLDFGCGSGRVLRAIPGLTGADVIGTDLHETAIDWCRQHYPFGTFLDGVLEPPLPLEDDSVDAMLALSVLTHLDREKCDLWLREWKRILKPGSIAVVTFHGEGLMDARIPEGTEARAAIEEDLDKNDGIAFLDNKAWRGIFPDEYQTTYHRNAHVRDVWGEVFEVCAILPSGSFVNKQDVAILRA